LLTQEWTYYDHSTTVFQPKNMSPFELQAGRLWVLREFTRASSVLQRLPANMDHPLYHLVTNLGFHMACRTELKGLPRLAARLFGPEAQDEACLPGGQAFPGRGAGPAPAARLPRFPLWNLRLADLFSPGPAEEGV